MKITFDTTDANEVAEAAGLIAMLQGHTGTVTTLTGAHNPAPMPAAPAPAAPAPAAPMPAAPAPAAPAPAAPMPAAPAPAAPAPAAPAPAAPAAPAGAPSQADVASAIQKYAQTHSPAAAKAKLAEYGWKKAGDVPPEHYAFAIQHMAV